jgi:dipeptidyl aminopeptidase/acylaminoacyl peptidase
MLFRPALAVIGIAMLVVAFSTPAQQSYQRPPDEIAELLDAPVPPVPFVSTAGNAMILATPPQYRTISDIAEPTIRGAGVRINPRNNGYYMANVYYVALKVQRLPQGPAMDVALPAGVRASAPAWNASGSMFAFTNTTATEVELWVGDVAGATARRIEGVRLNPVLSFGVSWMPDQKTLLVKLVPGERGDPPVDASVPAGPRIEDSAGVKTASSTYQAVEVLRTPHEADLFEYYTTSQIAIVDALTGRVTAIGKPDVYWKLIPAPGGQYLLVERFLRPYSTIRTFLHFQTAVEVWDMAGRKIETLAIQPLAEEVPAEGVRVGPRNHEWRATAPATVVWLEALDDGDTYRKVPHHDRVMVRPVGGESSELARLEQRFDDLQWIEGSSLALLTELDWDKFLARTWLVDADRRTSPPRVLWSYDLNDQYAKPGDLVLGRLPNGGIVVRQHKGAIFTKGEGASPTGNRPFLDRTDLRTLKSERLFRSSPDSLESFVAWVDLQKGTFLTRRESAVDPPNIFLRSLGRPLPSNTAQGEARFRSTARQLTNFVDPTGGLRRVSRRLITYERPDGVKLSFTLYLPPDYQSGTRLPTVMWAYPLDYTTASTAGQVTTTVQKFTTVTGASPIFLALAGYAVLDETAMPVVGPTATAYDTFNEQIVANAKAAIEKAVELGVTDPERVGVIGHSHGGLMVANLLAWSDLFRAGVARSAAYNHTLRPFGFQFERRTLYQARHTYLELSPLLYADKIDEPLLIMHGERDNNPATEPLQSQKMYEAVRGAGGTVRLVMLPFELHGYVARESVRHALWETLRWFDMHVKNAPPRAKPAGGG